VRAVKPNPASAIHEFSPDDDAPSRRAAFEGIAASLREASSRRLRYRLRIQWGDAAAPSGRREELVEFCHPRRLLDLVSRITTTPDRPLLGMEFESIAKPIWQPVHVPFILWRAAQKNRRDEISAVMERRAAARQKLKREGAR
jgi:hypothetical protein